MSYSEACILFQVEQLECSRLGLCYSFIRKTMHNPKHSSLFVKRKHTITRDQNNTFVEYKSRHKIHYTSPLVFLTRLGNKLLNC